MKGWYLSQRYPGDVLEQLQRNNGEMLKNYTVFVVQLLLRGGLIDGRNLEKTIQYLMKNNYQYLCECVLGKLRNVLTSELINSILGQYQ